MKSLAGIAYLFSYFFSRLQVFFILPLLTKYISIEQMGVLEIIGTFNFLVMVIIGFNLDSSVASYFHDIEVRSEKNQLFWSAFVCNILLGLVVLTAVAILNRPLLDVMNLEKESNPVLLVLLSVCSALTSVLISNFNNVFRLLFQNIKFSISLILNTSLVLLCTCIAVLIKPNAFSVVWAGLVANVLTLLVLLIMSNKDLKVNVCLSRWLKPFLNVSAPLLPFSFAAWGLGMSDRTILNYFSGIEALGKYGVLVKIASISGVIVGPFQLIWLPYAMNSWKKNGGELFARMFSLFCGLSLIVVLSIDGFSHYIVRLMAGEKYLDLTSLVSIMVLSNILGVIYYFPLASFMRTKRMYASSVAFLLGAVLNVCTNILIIPRLGWHGVVYANLIGYFGMVVIAFYFERIQTNVGYPVAKVLFVFFITIMFLAINQIINPSQMIYVAIVVLEIGILLGLLFYSRLLGSDCFRLVSILFGRSNRGI